ncbi:MAG TPA: hypothetical protein VHA56_00625 [Mucilaginibacter sp.]|nr:hypothetical protein [Mucilaginibacter sp.]
MENQITITSLIIIVWLIFPGVVFKRFYFQGQFTKQFGAGLFADRLITSIFWGIVVQIVTFLLYSKSLGFTFAGIKDKIGEAYSNIVENKLPLDTYQYLKYILLYLVCLIFMAAVLGTIFHNLIRLFKIDLKLAVFRFSNHWNYYFRGEILSTRDFKNIKRGKVLSTMVDVLVDNGTEKNKMVQGFLTQYSISHKTGELDAIYLTCAKRYSESKKCFKDIPGDCLIIPYEKVLDMNLRFNTKIIDEDKRKQKIYAIITFVGVSTGLLGLMIFPWYLHAGIIRTVLGIIFSIISWLLFITIISNRYQTDSRSKLTVKGATLTLVLMLVFAAVALIFFKIIVY